MQIANFKPLGYDLPSVVEMIACIAATIISSDEVLSPGWNYARCRVGDSTLSGPVEPPPFVGLSDAGLEFSPSHVSPLSVGVFMVRKLS